MRNHQIVLESVYMRNHQIVLECVYMRNHQTVLECLNEEPPDSSRVYEEPSVGSRVFI